MEKIGDKLKQLLKENKGLFRILAVLFVLTFIASQIKGCVEKIKQEEKSARPVHTAVSVKDDVPRYVDSFGTFTSPDSVDVVAQVTGKIVGLHFKEGSRVSEGQLLFTIDDRDYKAALRKAEAQLIKDRAQLKLKQDTLVRNEKLFEKELLSRQDLDTYRTEVASAAAQVRLDEANVEIAGIDLEYCRVISPIDGIAGKALVTVGNVVTANDGPALVNVKSIDPLRVDFTLPEKYLTDVQASMKSGELKVEVTVQGENNSHEGILKMIDNTVQDETGTISLRARVPNENSALWPGQFVRVRLILGAIKDAVIVPYDAVQMGKKGYYAFVVGKDHRAELRQLKVGEKLDDRIVVKEGISPGETVVTQGQMGLAPGVIAFDVGKKKGGKK